MASDNLKTIEKGVDVLEEALRKSKELRDSLPPDEEAPATPKQEKPSAPEAQKQPDKPKDKPASPAEPSRTRYLPNRTELAGGALVGLRILIAGSVLGVATAFIVLLGAAPALFPAIVLAYKLELAVGALVAAAVTSYFAFTRP